MIGKHKNIINLLGACTQDGEWMFSAKLSSAAICFADGKGHTSTLCVLFRPSVCGGGVRLAGKPEGVPPCPSTCRPGVLERLPARFSGQFGGHGAGFCSISGGQRNGIPRLQKGAFTIIQGDYTEVSCV